MRFRASLLRPGAILVMKYKFIDDLTSDVMFEAYGKDLKELFENSAEAMMSVICQIEKIRARDSRKIEISGKGERDLLLNWLQELIALVDTENMFFSRFELAEISPTGLKATVWGEDADPARGETVVKALTYHKFGLEKRGKGWVARVTLDI
jgi:SHS2 domain-containing protein